MQHMAVARAHTMVEMTFRAHTLKSSSCRRRTETQERREVVSGKGEGEERRRKEGTQ